MSESSFSGVWGDWAEESYDIGEGVTSDLDPTFFRTHLDFCTRGHIASPISSLKVGTDIRMTNGLLAVHGTWLPKTTCVAWQLSVPGNIGDDTMEHKPSKLTSLITALHHTSAARALSCSVVLVRKGISFGWLIFKGPFP